MTQLQGKKLLILGATAGETTLVKRAQKLGVYVIVTDYNTDYALSPAKYIADECWDISWSDIDTLEKLSRENEIDGVLAGYSEFRVENMIKLCKRLNLPCYINDEQLEITRDKIKFKDCCRKYGVPVVKEYASIDEVDEYPVIVKPTDRAGSIGISIAYNFEELEKAYQYAVNTSAKFGNDSLGYTPEPLSISYTLEYAYADWCVAQLAKALGKEEDAKRFYEKGQAYRNMFDAEKGWFRPRNADGSWKAWPENALTEEWYGCIESNAYQQGWFVPHDVEGLVKLMGGEEAFVEKLDSLFTVDSSLDGETTSADISGLIGQYAHGNEPSHHVIHLYNYVNRPWRTQELVDSVYRSQYANNVDGLSGNEDCGQMSAWYILNSMGFYQVCPGKPVYSIGRPAFDKAVINLPSEKTFSIVVKNNSKSNKYIESVLLNGKALDTPFFGHQDIVAGGIMEIKMTDHPTQRGSNNSSQ